MTRVKESIQHNKEVSFTKKMEAHQGCNIVVFPNDLSRIKKKDSVSRSNTNNDFKFKSSHETEQDARIGCRTESI